MAIQRSTLPLVIGAALAALPAQGPTTASPAAPSPVEAATSRKPAITIGVVDLDKAIDRYGLAVRERERLQKLSEQFNDELKTLTQAIDELRGQMSLLKPGSIDYDQKDLELRLAMNQREGLAQLRKKQFDRQLEIFELEVYLDMEFAVARVAADRGVAVVVRAQNVIDLEPQEGEDPASLQKAKLMQFNRRTVWYTSPEVDLTPYVIKYLQVFDPRAERKKAAEAAARSDGDGKQPPKPDGK